MNDKGFTLVEVVIASMILFSVLAAGSLGLKTSFDAMEKATSSAYMAVSLKEVMDRIKPMLEKGQLNGVGKIDKKNSFSYRAQVIASGKNIISQGDFQSNDLVFGNFLLKLYLVELELKASVGKRIKNKSYAYKELVWRKNNS